MELPRTNASEDLQTEDIRSYNHAKLTYRLSKSFSPYDTQYDILPELELPGTMLNEGEASPVPDLILYDNQTRTTPVIIEVCHTEGLRKDLRKVVGLIDGDEYGIEEGFVYDYLAGQWYCYRRGNGGLTETSSSSRVLNLNPFLLP